MDNLGSHKGQALRQLIRAAGAKLFFLPRYSPDLNPIEQVFAKLKTPLRKTDPRTTWRGIGTLLDRFTPQECANYLANAGIFEALEREVDALSDNDNALSDDERAAREREVTACILLAEREK